MSVVCVHRCEGRGALYEGDGVPAAAVGVQGDALLLEARDVVGADHAIVEGAISGGQGV